MRGLRTIAVGAAIAVGILLPLTAQAEMAKGPDVRTVLAALREAGIDGAQRLADNESEDASYLTARGSNWSIWVFKPPTVVTDMDLSGKGWRISLTDAKPGRLYWTRWVSDHTLDPLLPRKTGSYRAISIYGDNIALIYRLDTRRGAPHRTRDKMPGAWIIVNETLVALVK